MKIKNAVPRVVYLLLPALAIGMFSLVVLAPHIKWSGWASAAQIIAMIATLVTLVGVWSQLAVQTVVAILSTAQQTQIRDARGRLFVAEDASGISSLPCSSEARTNQWTPEWKAAADEVCQNWSSVAYMLRIDPVARFLIRPYIAKSRRAILKSHLYRPTPNCRSQNYVQGRPGRYVGGF